MKKNYITPNKIKIKILSSKIEQNYIKNLLEKNKQLRINFDDQSFFKTAYFYAEILFISYIAEKTNYFLISEYPNVSLSNGVNRDSGEDIIFLSSKFPYFNIREIKAFKFTPKDIKQLTNQIKNKIKSALKESFGGKFKKSDNTKIISVKKLKFKIKTTSKTSLEKVRIFEEKHSFQKDYFFNKICNYLESIKKGKYEDEITQTFILSPIGEIGKILDIEINSKIYTTPQNKTHIASIWQLEKYDEKIKISFHKNE